VSRRAEVAAADQTMIMETLHLIWCRCSTKSEIFRDYGAARAAGAADWPRTALTVTTHHLSQRLAVTARVPEDVSRLRVRRSREDEQQVGQAV
jgi:hypothetical protein